MLKFSDIIAPTSYMDRKCRFYVEFRQISQPLNLLGLEKYYEFSYNVEKRRISYVLPRNKVFRGQFSTKLMSTDENAEKFLYEFLKQNPFIKQTDYLYYVADDQGIDIPFIPDVTDAISFPDRDFSNLIPLALIGVFAFFLIKNKK